jgi:hypothetical protein
MIAAGWSSAARLPLLVAGVLVAGGARSGALCESTATCLPGACDPLCVDVGRYSVTQEIVDDTRDDHRLWQRLVSARLSQPDAVSYCAGLSLGGLGGWRLPSPQELSGIRYKPGGLFGGGSSHHYCIPSIDQAAFPETPAALFWTSKANSDDTAWYVGFDDGRMHRDTRTDELWVRCTHDPLSP